MDSEVSQVLDQIRLGLHPPRMTEALGLTDRKSAQPSTRRATGIGVTRGAAGRLPVRLLRICVIDQV